VRGLALLGIFALTLILRLWGFAQGYPGFYGHVDEIGVAASIWNFFRAATLQPTEFTYPAFYSYLVAAGLWLTHAMGWGPDLGRLSESLIFVSYLDPGRAVLVGRVFSAGLSALVPLLTYALGKEAFNPRVGSIAALFVAIALVPVIHAHQALPDSAMALGAALCFYCSWRIYTCGSWRYYLLAGFVAGLVVATKYNGAFTAFAIPAAHCLRSDRTLRSLVAPRLWGSIFLAILALLVGSPYLFLASDKYWALAHYQISSLDFALGERTPWWWIVRSLPQAEWLVGGLMLGGMAWSLYRREALDWILWAAWLPSFLYIGSWTRESLHYLLHFYPVWALEAARLLEAGVVRVIPGRTWLVSAMAVCCTLPSIYQVVLYNRELGKPDLRQEVADWIRTNIPDGTRLAMNWLPYCPELPLKRVRENIARGYAENPQAQELLQEAWSGVPAYELVNLEVWLKQPVVPEFYQDKIDLDDPETRRVFSRGWLSPRQLRQRGVQYIVLPDAAIGRFLHGDPPSALSGAAHYHYHKNRAYFSNLIAADNLATEEIVRFESRSGFRGASISIFRLR